MFGIAQKQIVLGLSKDISLDNRATPQDSLLLYGLPVAPVHISLADIIAAARGHPIRMGIIAKGSDSVTAIIQSGIWFLSSDDNLGNYLLMRFEVPPIQRISSVVRRQGNETLSSKCKEARESRCLVWRGWSSKRQSC